MNALALSLLLALAAAGEEAETLRQPALAGVSPRPIAPPEMRPSEACAAAREIASQPACLASGDCRALQLWRRSFGAPGLRLLDPGRAGQPPVEGGGGLRRGPLDRTRRPPRGVARTRPETPVRPLAPGFVCPAGDDPPG